MKAEFYYKEEFPLELRITIENLTELAYLLTTLSYGTFRNDKPSDWSGYASEILNISKDRTSDFKNISIEDVKKIGETLAEVYEKHESKHVLQRDVPEGASDTN